MKSVLTWPTLLRPRDSKSVLILVCVQQCIVAASVLFLAKFVSTLALGHPNLLWLYLYLASLVAPYLPASFGVIFLKKWEIQSQKDFFSLATDRLFGSITSLTSGEKRLEKTSILSKDGALLITDLTRYIFNTVLVALNSLLSILVICWLFGSQFAISYFIGAGIAALLVYLVSPANKKLSLIAEGHRIELGQALLTCDDNLVYGNAINRDIWQNQFLKRFFLMRRSAINASYLQEMASIAIPLAMFVPTLLSIWLFFKHSGNLADSAAMAATLPRVFLILNSMTSLLYFLRNFSVLKGRLEKLNHAFQFEDEKIDKRITLSAIRIEGRIEGQGVSRIGSLDDLIEQLPKVGWLTIRGKNGAGKSSLLLVLKQKFGHDAFYYPANGKMLFEENGGGYSTGNQMVNNLRILFSQLPVKYLLLDEWDANLDDHNRAILSNELQLISKSILVIDVRHRPDSESSTGSRLGST